MASFLAFFCFVFFKEGSLFSDLLNLRSPIYERSQSAPQTTVFFPNTKDGLGLKIFSSLSSDYVTLVIEDLICVLAAA